MAALTPDLQIASPAPAKPFPGFLQAVLLIGLYVFFQVVFVLPFRSFDRVAHTQLGRHPVVYALVVFAAGGVVIWVAREWRGRTFRQIAGPPAPLAVYLWTLVTMFGLLMFELPVMVWLSRRFPSFVPDLNLGLERSAWGAFLLAVVAAPLIEETIFRGIFLKGFMARYGTWRGIWLSAAFFGAVHLSFLRLIPTVSLGLLAGWMCWRTRSIWPGVLAHAANNSLAVLAVVGGSAPKGQLGKFSWGEVVISVGGATVLAYGIDGLRQAFAGIVYPEPADPQSSGSGCGTDSEIS